MTKKTAVLLIQLGTPDSPGVSDVRRYLKEFLNDPRVIDLPAYKRIPLVNGIIVPFRAPKSAKIYKELWKAGDGESPLITYSKSITEKLQNVLPDHVDMFLAMRYGNPSMDDVLEKIRKGNYQKLVLFPLYPQYASASTGSSVEKAFKIINKWWVIPEVSVIGQFYDDPGFIDCFAEVGRKFNVADYDHVLFSYHGLPERQVDKVYETGLCSDRDCENEITEENAMCYKATCYATTRLLTEKLDIPADKHDVGFQSRLDDKWIKPYSDQLIKKYASEGKKKILVFSPAFVADCLETIIEIGVEYQEEFEAAGGEKVQLVPSLNDNPSWVKYLENKIEEYL